MSDVLDTVLLLALPAAGKSEVRTYLGGLPRERLREELHLGAMTQLDDFPYVHLMRRVDEELARLGREPVFYDGPGGPFRERRDWGTLIALLGVEYRALRAGGFAMPETGAALLDALDRAREQVGAAPALAGLPGEARARLAAALDGDAARAAAGRRAELAGARQGGTWIVEFARGGPEGASMPLPAPYGYRYALSLLPAEFLERTTILNVWTTPEESRRRNRERADPDDPGSILHHGVPERVMREDYGCDDLDFLIGVSDRPGTVRVDASGRTFHVPIARLDNRVDRTSFVRNERSTWTRAQIDGLHGPLREAFADLYRRRTGR